MYYVKQGRAPLVRRPPEFTSAAEIVAANIINFRSLLVEHEAPDLGVNRRRRDP